MRIPPSLRNIYKELADEVPGFVIPKHGYGPHCPCPCLVTCVTDREDGRDLTEWAKHGVLLLNTSLTVRAHEVSFSQGSAPRGTELTNGLGGIALESRMGDFHSCRPPRNHLAPRPHPGGRRGGGGGTRGGIYGLGQARPDNVCRCRQGVSASPSSPSSSFRIPHYEARPDPVLMVRQKKHLVLSSAHPSPFAAMKGFFGNGHFEKANAWLEERYGEKGGIDWAALGPKV